MFPLYFLKNIKQNNLEPLHTATTYTPADSRFMILSFRVTHVTLNNQIMEHNKYRYFLIYFFDVTNETQNMCISQHIFYLLPQIPHTHTHTSSTPKTKPASNHTPS